MSCEPTETDGSNDFDESGYRDFDAFSIFDDSEMPSVFDEFDTSEA
jgi:hypothetical protein